MKRVLCVGLLGLLATVLPAYRILYAEQYYQMYHRNLYMYPEEYRYNLWILEHALAADFANPLNALSHEIGDKLDHERYRYLFKMHANLEMTKLYRELAAGYDKREAFYFNAPWRETTLRSLRYAESYYEAALYYWDVALEWSHRAWRLRGIDLTDIADWQDINLRVEIGELDYLDLLRGDLARLRSVREKFAAMDETTF